MQNNSLQSRIPNSIFTLEFSLSIGCRLNCKYCPQKLFIQSYQKQFPSASKQMSLSVFKTILNKLPAGASISFSGMAEPFLNPFAIDMIRYAYDRGFKLYLATSLVGLKESDLYKLRDVKFVEGLILHIPDMEGNSQFILDTSYFSLLKKAHEFWNVTYYSCHGTIHPEVSDLICKEKFKATAMMNRAGNLNNPALKTYYNKDSIECGAGNAMKRTAHNMVVLPNGAVILCCMDYGLKHVLGNILSQQWREIYNSPAYISFEKGKQDESIPLLCRTCSSAVSQNAVWQEWRYYTYNAVKLGRLIETLQSCPERFSPKVYSQKQRLLLQKIISAKHICIFGIGKLFKDNYQMCGWSEVFHADILSDNDPEKWGKYYGDIPCVPPESLLKFEDLLIVLYIKDNHPIRTFLHSIGLHNCISIYDLFNFHLL